MEQMVAMLGEFGLAVCLVVTFVVMFWKMWNMQREDNNRREERDRETITHLSEIMSTNSRALLKNSETMEKINEKIDNIDSKLEDVKMDVQEIKLRQKAKDNNN